MKSLPFVLVFAAALSCRAETSASKPADSAKPAPAKTEESAPAKPAEEASKKPAPQSTEESPTIIAAVVAKPMSLKPFGFDMKKSLSDSMAEQQAAMAQSLADQAQSQKALVSGYLTVDQPALPTVNAPSMTKNANGTATVVIAGKATEFKTEADAKAFLAQQQRNQPSAALGAPTSEIKNMGAAAFRAK